MFEQSILAGHPGHKGWGFFASVTMQITLVTIGALLPLIDTNRLPLAQLITPLALPLPLPPAAPQRAAPHQRARLRSPSTTIIFTAPARIPQRVAPIIDEPFAPLIDVQGPGVPGGTGAGAGINPLASLIAKAPPPPVTAAPKQPPPRGPLRVSRGVQEARLIRRVLPVYPPLARGARVSGTVHLIGIIGKDGAIRNLQVLSGHPLLVNAAVAAVNQWLYQPTTLSGEPVEVICPIDVNFTLN